jgi:tol-pal system protein YbgF
VIFARFSRLTTASLALLVATPVAHAQGFDFFHRQSAQTAQMAPPASIPGAAEGGASEAATEVLRINRLEDELRQANGRIEELENAQHRLEDQLQKFRQDVEFRFGAHSGEGSPAPVAAATPPAAGLETAAPMKPKRADAFDPNAEPNAPGAPHQLGTTLPSAPLPRASAAAGPPLELGHARPPAPPAASGPTIVGSGVAMLDAPREQFGVALQAFQAGEYAQAEQEFKAFMAANPAHRLTPDAIYYIGETYLQRSRPREAAENYLKVTTSYAKSAIAPASMVRLGQTLAALGNSEQACATFGEFDKRYPTASASVKKLAEREMAKDHC